MYAQQAIIVEGEKWLDGIPSIAADELLYVRLVCLQKTNYGCSVLQQSSVLAGTPIGVEYICIYIFSYQQVGRVQPTTYYCVTPVVKPLLYTDACVLLFFFFNIIAT